MDNKSARPLVSIITVCLNDHDGLARTWESIEMQSMSRFEWIVVDGGSKDGTLSFLENLKDSRLRYISEADEGIYHAMNKGIQLATGDWLWFLNAADRAYDDMVLELISSLRENPDIIFSDVTMDTREGTLLGPRSKCLPHKVPEFLRKRDFKHGMVVSHQGFIVKRSIAFRYRTNYHYSSDLDWMLRILAEPRESKRIQSVAFVQREGATTENWFRSQYERFLILCHHFGSLNTVGSHLYILMRRSFFVLLKKNVNGS